MPYADLTTGARLHYEDLGSSDAAQTAVPVVAVHGFFGTARYDLGDVLDWLASGAAGRYRVIGPTLRGYGLSTPKPRRFPHDFYRQDRDDLLAFMDALGLDDVHLLGYSDGGEVALLAAADQPQRFRSVVTWGAVGHFDRAVLSAVQSLYPPHWITREQLALHDLDRAEPLVLGWIKAMKQMIELGGDVSLSIADQITVPLLLMLGTGDMLNPVSAGQQYVDRTPQGRLRTFACGHAVHREARDEFRQAVTAFLNESSSR